MKEKSKLYFFKLNYPLLIISELVSYPNYYRYLTVNDEVLISDNIAHKLNAQVLQDIKEIDLQIYEKENDVKVILCSFLKIYWHFCFKDCLKSLTYIT